MKKERKKKNNKKRKPCVPLDEQQSRQLARLIIGQTRRNVRYGVNREERIAAPSGAVILLSTAFIPLAQNNLTVDCYDSGECNSINVITRDNYEFLRDSYFRYSLLLQKEGVHMPGNSIGEGIANLYDEMNTLVGDELHVNIEQEAGRLFFRLWKYHKWGSFTLYYFPVKFLESLNPILR